MTLDSDAIRPWRINCTVKRARPTVQDQYRIAVVARGCAVDDGWYSQIMTSRASRRGLLHREKRGVTAAGRGSDRAGNGLVHRSSTWHSWQTVTVLTVTRH
jgi:hypothetical protein